MSWNPECSEPNNFCGVEDRAVFNSKTKLWNDVGCCTMKSAGAIYKKFTHPERTACMWLCVNPSNVPPGVSLGDYLAMAEHNNKDIPSAAYRFATVKLCPGWSGQGAVCRKCKEGPLVAHQLIKFMNRQHEREVYLQDTLSRLPDWQKNAARDFEL